MSRSRLSPLPPTAGGRHHHPDLRRRPRLSLDAERCGARGDLRTSASVLHHMFNHLNEIISDGYAWETFLASVSAGSRKTTETYNKRQTKRRASKEFEASSSSQ